jgi:hypothetical protein
MHIPPNLTEQAMTILRILNAHDIKNICINWAHVTTYYDGDCPPYRETRSEVDYIPAFVDTVLTIIIVNTIRIHADPNVKIYGHSNAIFVDRRAESKTAVIMQSVPQNEPLWTSCIRDIVKMEFIDPSSARWIPYNFQIDEVYGYCTLWTIFHSTMYVINYSKSVDFVAPWRSLYDLGPSLVYSVTLLSKLGLYS